MNPATGMKAEWEINYSILSLTLGTYQVWAIGHPGIKLPLRIPSGKGEWTVSRAGTEIIAEDLQSQKRIHQIKISECSSDQSYEAPGSGRVETQAHLPWQYQELEWEQDPKGIQPSSDYALRVGLRDSCELCLLLWFILTTALFSHIWHFFTFQRLVIQSTAVDPPHFMAESHTQAMNLSRPLDCLRDVPFHTHDPLYSSHLALCWLLSLKALYF